MAGMTPTSTSSFPTMGDSGYEGLVNMSGQRSPYTREQPKHGPTTPDTGGSPAGGRPAGAMVQGTYGPAFRPVASMAYGTQYPETGRGMRVVPSAIGSRDFWAARASNGAGYDV
jgi:hypothetical protein